MKISNFFIARPKFSMVIAVVMVLLGVMAILILPVSQYPQITPPQVVVQAVYPGANAKVLLENVAVPIENVINGVEGMLYMSSTSDDTGIYQLTITFDIGIDPNMAQVKVENRLSQVVSLLPEIVNKEGVSVKVQAANILALLVLRSPNNTYDDLFLSNFAFVNLQNSLERVNGISDVLVYGPQNSIRVWVNPVKVNSISMSVLDIVNAIQLQNTVASLGGIGVAPSDNVAVVMSIMAKGFLHSIIDFENIIINTDKFGGVVKLKDVAKVEIGADSYNVQAKFNNSPAVVLGISQAPDTNSFEIMKVLKSEMGRLKLGFPEDMEFEIAYDSTKFVSASISSIISTLILTFCLVVLIIFIFLQNFWAVGIPVITIPVSLIGAFSVLYLVGFDINILVLFAMILAIGLVVDDAIIVVERAEYLIRDKKIDSKKAAIMAMDQIGSAVIATTLVLLSIFVPVSLMMGLTGEIYRQFAITIVVAIVFSAVNALTLSPMLASKFLKNKVKVSKWSKFFDWFNVWFDKVKSVYLSIIKFLLNRLRLSALIFIIVCFSVGFLFYITPTSFIPNEDQGILFSNVELNQTASLDRTKKILFNMGDRVLPIKGVKYFISVAGVSLIGGNGENIGMGIVGLDDWSMRARSDLSSRELLKKFQYMFMGNVGESVDFYSLPAIPGIGNSSGLSFQLNAINQNITEEELYHKLVFVLEKINTSPLFAFGFSPFANLSPHIFLDIDRMKLISYGIGVEELFSTLQVILGSSYVNKITMSGQIVKVIVQAQSDFRKNFDDIKNIYIKNKMGKMMQVKDFTSLSIILSPKVIYRFNQYLTAAITAQVNDGVSTGQAIAEISKIVKALGNNYSVSWTGMSLQEVETQGLIFILISIAFVFGYLFLVALYESWLVAFAVMFSNVFAVLGAIVGLWIMGLSLSIYAQLGIILIIGLASKNAILIVEFILNKRRSGDGVIEACLYGVNERFRAVVMTALTFILGVMPMIFATGAGANSQIAIGVSVFFGMIFSLFFGIIFIPVLFAIFDLIGQKFANKEVK